MATLTQNYMLIAEKYLGAIQGSGVSYKDVYLRIYAKYTSQDIVNAKSAVAYKLTLRVTGSGYFYTGNTTTKALSGTGATAVSGDGAGNYYAGETTLHEITGTVAHNASTGAASVSISASWNSGPWGVGGTASGSADLPTIARATTPTTSADSVTMGQSVTITLNPANGSFKHKIRYDFMNLINSVVGLSIGDAFTAAGNSTVTFTPPTSFAEQIPDLNNAWCRIYCYTYNASGTHIGTTIKDIMVYVPDYTPKISSIELVGNNLLNGEYIQQISTVTVRTVVTLPYYAYAKDITAIVDGQTFKESTFTSQPLSSGTKKVKITITDSRGKPASLESPVFEVYPYYLPEITSFTLDRQADGTTVVASMQGRVAPVNNKNKKLVQIALNGEVKTIDTNSYSINATTTFTGVPTDNTLTAATTITDSYTSIYKNATLPTVAVTMDWYRDGTGIAFGKVAESPNLLDVAWNIKNDSIPTLLGGFGHPIPEKADINTLDYITPGNYVCNLNDVAKTLTNCPTQWAFKMCVYNCLDTWTNVQTGSYMYLIREITDFEGKKWVQYVRKEGGGWYYAPWRMIIDTGTCKDYVIEQGPWDGWNYVRWNSGKLELFGEKSLSFPEGTKQADYLYRSIVSFDLSNWFTKIMSGTCCVQVNGMVPQVCRHSTNLATAEIVIVTSRTIPAFTITAPVYIVGKWK